MKKLISLLLALCMAFALVSACADADVTGEWYASVMGMAMTMKLNADGTGVMTSAGEEAEAAAAWTLDGDTITVTVDGSSVSGPVTADSITLDMGGIEAAFTREPVEAITVAEVTAADSEDAFTGTWRCAYIDMDGVLMDLSVMQGTLMPDISIQGGDISFIASSDEDLFAIMYGALGLKYTFDGGKLTMASTAEGADKTGVVELLEDGMIRFALDGDGESALTAYFRKAAE